MRSFISRALLLAVASSTAGATAGNASSWFPMPDGHWYHASCIHNHNAPFHLERQSSNAVRVTTTTTPAGAAAGAAAAPVTVTHEYGPCPYPRRSAPPSSNTADTSTDAETGGDIGTETAAGPGRLGYYSDWSVYAQHANEAGLYSKMQNTWQVPPKVRGWRVGLGPGRARQRERENIRETERQRQRAREKREGREPSIAANGLRDR